MSDAETFIHRSPHDKENPYAMISRDLIRDESLSMSCRWMLIYLLSQSGEWRISVKQIWNHSKKHRGGGRDSVRGWIKEACDAGYMMAEEYKNEKNLNRIRYYLSEAPRFKKCFLRPEFQEPEKSAPTAHTYKNKHPSSLEEVKKNGPSDPPPSTFVEFIKYPKVTKMPINSFSALVDEHGKELVDAYLEKLNDYADIDPGRFKKYANHATVIKNWIKRDKEKSRPLNPKTYLSTLLNKIKENNIPLLRSGEIEIKENSIAFKRGSYYREISFEEKDALDKIRQEAMKARARI